MGQGLGEGVLVWGLVLVAVASQASRDPAAGAGASRRKWGRVGGWATSGVGVSLWFRLRKQQVPWQPLRAPPPCSHPLPDTPHPPTKRHKGISRAHIWEELTNSFAICYLSLFFFFFLNIIPNILGGP